jgi:glycosyltransferase involved in cell wall biosynthesis
MSVLAMPQNALDPQPEELYVEIGALLAKNLTGIGRFVARLVEALSRYRSLRLVNGIQGRLAKHMRLSNALLGGEEITVPRFGLPPADPDLKEWVKRLLRRPRGPIDKGCARSSPTLFTALRPKERQSEREVGILYDFCPVLLPWTQVEETRRHFLRYYTETAPLCDRLVAISYSTGKDARWLSSIPAGQIRTGYPGPSLCVGSHSSSRPAPPSKNIVLVVSTLEPRKNGCFLFDWFSRTEVLGPQMELWWVGPRGWLWQPLAAGLSSRSRRRKVKLLGVVSDQCLCELYRAAAFTIYPSLYEGFGFPVLDSLRHQTPVLCGFHSSLQEFAGPGVYYFDPYDPLSLDEACRSLLSELTSGFTRDDLESKFSWERLAQQVLSCFEDDKMTR